MVGHGKGHCLLLVSHRRGPLATLLLRQLTNLPEEIQLSPEADEDVSTGWFTGEVRPGGEDNEFKLF